MTPERVVVLVFAAAVAVVAGAPGTPGAEAADKDCSDFSNQKQAQEFFERHGTEEDPHGLDAEGDDVACESLPCPCNEPGFLTRLPNDVLEFFGNNVIGNVIAGGIVAGIGWLITRRWRREREPS